MALNNLRVVYNNLVDLNTTIITGISSQTSNPVTNMKLDAKGSTWRSAATTTASSTVSSALKIDLGSVQSINSIILPFTNLASASATITVTGYTVLPTTFTDNANGTITIGGGTATGTATTAMLCCPWNSLSLSAWGTNPIASNIYAYGGGTYARAWLTNTINARYFVIQINDTYATSDTGYYIEVSRLIMGMYWSPKYNTGYGMTNTIKDLTVHERTESGDLISQRGPRFSALSFDLKWLDPSDRVILSKIMLGNGMPKPLLISLFPDNTANWEMERAHQIYGKLMSMPGVSYSMLDIYSTQFDVEEV